jgi:hypothetical protein
LRQNISPIVWSTLSYKLACMNTRVKYHISVQEEVTRFPQGPSRDFSHWAFWLEPCLGPTSGLHSSRETISLVIVGGGGLAWSHVDPTHLLQVRPWLAGCSAGLRVWMVPWKFQGMASVQQWAGLRKWCAGVLGLLTGPGWAGPQPSSYNLRDTLAAGPWHMNGSGETFQWVSGVRLSKNKSTWLAISFLHKCSIKWAFKFGHATPTVDT